MQANGYPPYGINYGDTPNLDAFSRLRVASGKTLFESTFQYSLKRALWFQKFTGTGAVAHDAWRSSANLTVSTAGSIALLQTKSYIPYEPGKSQLIKMTFVNGARKADKEIGYGDDTDGIFYQIKNVHESFFVLRSSVPMYTALDGAVGPTQTETVVPRQQWNIDRMDGGGPSGQILDTSKQQILVIDLQFLGVGRVRCGFNIDGKIYYVHSFDNANEQSIAPYMRTGTLPLRYKITGTDSTLDLLQCVCAEVESEGGSEPITYDFSAFTPADIAVASGVRTHLISVRPKLLYRGLIPNRMGIILISVDVLGGTNPVRIDTLYNSQVTGGVWTSANDLSCAEYNIGGTVADIPSSPSDCGTIATQSFFVPSGTGSLRTTTSATFTNQFPITLDIDGLVQTNYSVVATGIGAANIRCAVSWKEIR